MEGRGGGGGRERGAKHRGGDEQCMVEGVIMRWRQKGEVGVKGGWKEKE